jgi:hypothetical protein
MLEIYAFVFSIFLIGLSIRFFYELHSHQKYVKSIFGVMQNFFLVFCIIFLINLLSVSILRNISQGVSNLDIQGIASTVENHDISRITEK